MSHSSLQNSKTLVVTVHGIRTFGGWQERWEEIYREHSNEDVEFVHYKYGYFSIISFIFPITRFIAVLLFNKFMSPHYDRSYAHIHFFGHSFGTHLIAHGLRRFRNQTINVHSIFLTGSVLRSNFDWTTLGNNRPQRLVNDCGDSDIVLLTNQVFVLFSGMAGRIGLNGGMTRYFRNRFHQFGHSGYFQNKDGPYDDWMKTFWLPLASEPSSEIIGFDDRPELTWRRGLLIAVTEYIEPIKMTLYGLVTV